MQHALLKHSVVDCARPKRHQGRGCLHVPQLKHSQKHENAEVNTREAQQSKVSVRHMGSRNSNVHLHKRSLRGSIPRTTTNKATRIEDTSETLMGDRLTTYRAPQKVPFADTAEEIRPQMRPSLDSGAWTAVAASPTFRDSEAGHDQMLLGRQGQAMLLLEWQQ